MEKNEPVSIDTLVIIYSVLDVDIGDIITMKYE